MYTMHESELIESLTKRLTAATHARNQLRKQNQNKDYAISQLQEQCQALTTERDELREKIALLRVEQLSGVKRP